MTATGLVMALIVAASPLRGLDPVYQTPVLYVVCVPGAVAYSITCASGTAASPASVGVGAPGCAITNNMRLIALPVASSQCRNQVAVYDGVSTGQAKPEADVQCVTGGSGCPCQLMRHVVACP